MKKTIAILMSFVLGITLFVGCGDKEFNPKEVAQFNTIYRSTTNKEADGQYPVININGIKKESGSLIIEIGAPTMKQIEYAFDNYLTIKPMNSEGKEMNFDKYKIKHVGGNIEAELYVTGLDLSKIKWIEIGPYKTKDGNSVVFEVK